MITGASSGFGYSLALHTLRSGYSVIGTTRNVTAAKKSCPDFESSGGVWAELDPGSKFAQKNFEKLAEKHEIDVLVNNAAYIQIGSLEEVT